MPDATTILLIRHGMTGYVARAIAGRQPGIRLTDEGRAQAGELVSRLGHVPLAAIYSGPLERAQETAAPLAEHFGLPVRLCDEITELDFGQWTERSFVDLDGDTHWQRFNSFRSFTRADGGELMPEVQTRAVRTLERIRRDHPGRVVAVVSHGDVIRSAVAYVLGVPLDLFQRIEIRPASVSTVRISDEGPLVLGVNDTGSPRW